MLISDWSSDVCSSDLRHRIAIRPLVFINSWQLISRDVGTRLPLNNATVVAGIRRGTGNPILVVIAGRRAGIGHLGHVKIRPPLIPRSEERRVGKEGVSTSRSRGSAYHEKKTNK